LGNFHVADLLHAFFTFLLLLQEFSFAGYITTVAFGSHVFADGLDGFAGDDFSPDGGLDGNVELLARNQFFQFLADAFPERVSIVEVD